jgi:hypothetical protein
MGTELYKRIQLQILIQSGISSPKKLVKLTGVFRITVFNVKSGLKNVNQWKEREDQDFLRN